MNTVSLTLTNEEINKMITSFSDEIVKSNNPYIKYQIKTLDCVISIYTSNKAVFQGKDAHIYAAAFINKENRMAGSDEVGTGDYFGPVCVCACIVEKEDYPLLKELKVDDSKKIDDEKILNIAPILMNKLKYSLLILDNPKYNRAHDEYNLNQIKAKLHNQAYINLLHKGYDIPKACYVDQFEPKEAYFKHLYHEKEIYHDLSFETKAESKYIAVAAASIIARYAFIKSIEKMEAHYNVKLSKGASDIVDKDAYDFCLKYGFNRLNEVAKIHFKNTFKVQELLSKNHQ